MLLCEPRPQCSGHSQLAVSGVCITEAILLAYFNPAEHLANHRGGPCSVLGDLGTGVEGGEAGVDSLDI